MALHNLNYIKRITLVRIKLTRFLYDCTPYFFLKV